MDAVDSLRRDLLVVETYAADGQEAAGTEQDESGHPHDDEELDREVVEKRDVRQEQHVRLAGRTTLIRRQDIRIPDEAVLHRGQDDTCGESRASEACLMKFDRVEPTSAPWRWTSLREDAIPDYVL